MTKRGCLIFGVILLILAGVAGGYLLGARHGKPVETKPTASTEGDAEGRLYTCGMHPFYVQEGPGTCPICGMNLTPKKNGRQGERKIKHWQAPMDPTYIRDEPGKSPMGMDLIPVYEEGDNEEGLVKIDPVTVQNIGVRTTEVKKGTLSRTIRTVGRITYDERRIYHIHTKFDGWIDKLYVNFTGQQVRKGEPLIAIYSPDLVSTQKEYLQALDYHKRLGESGIKEVQTGGKSLLEATKRRLEMWDITDAQIEKLEKTQETKKNMTLYSPSEGIVVSMEAAREGMYVQPPMNLYTIADISHIWVEADIYEYELPWVELGQTATITLEYFPGREYEGKITFITPFLEPQTRTVKIRLELDNQDFALKPDMYANVVIFSDITREGLSVPREAVIHSGERNVIIIDRGEGRFEPRTVTLGAKAGEYYQILDGVKAGEKVVTSAQFLIDSESNLKAALSMMRPAAEGQPMMDPDLDMSDMTMHDILMDSEAEQVH